jgi:hypothetical protein
MSCWISPNGCSSSRNHGRRESIAQWYETFHPENGGAIRVPGYVRMLAILLVQKKIQIL